MPEIRAVVNRISFSELEDWVTPSVAARYIGISKSHLYEMCRSNRIPSKRWGRRCLRIPKAALAPRVEELAGV